MGEPVRISLDAMGGDHGPKVVVPAALRSLEQHPDLHLTIVGLSDAIRPFLGDAEERFGERLEILHASQCVAMDDPPSLALRSKKDSSMRVAIDLVKSGHVDACVSAGNTGALMATSRFVLKTLSGIDRPAIISPIPAVHGHTHMLDLGANADCSAEHLFQFAVMGSVVATAVYNQEAPRVALLNIGEEEIKGTERIKEAAGLISASGLNYIGFVEGNDIFSGKVDVVVTDGFTGNVALKTMEGLARMVKEDVKQEVRRNFLRKLSALFAWPVFKALKERLDPRGYNGASLVGLRGIVIKSHGGADRKSFENAIRIAMIEVDKAVPSKIERVLQAQLSERKAS